MVRFLHSQVLDKYWGNKDFLSIKICSQKTVGTDFKSIEAWTYCMFSVFCFEKTYRKVEDSLGVVFFHGVTVKGHVLDPAALGKEQVRSRGQRVDVRSRRGSDGRQHAAVFNTWQRQRPQIRDGAEESAGGAGLSGPPSTKQPVGSSHMGLLPGSERLPGISCPLRSTHQQYPVLPWHCVGSYSPFSSHVGMY